MISFRLHRTGRAKSSPRRARRRGSPPNMRATSSPTKTHFCRPNILRRKVGPTPGRCCVRMRTRPAARRSSHALLYLEDWCGGVPLRESPLLARQHRARRSRARRSNMRDGRTRRSPSASQSPVGGSDPASTRTTATWDAASANGSSRARRSSSPMPRVATPCWCWRAWSIPSGRGLSTFMVEKGTPGFSVGRQFRKMGIRFEDTAALVVLRLPRPRVQPYRRRPQEDAAVFQRVAARGRRLCARRLARRDGFHLGAPRGNRRDARLRRGPDCAQRRGGPHAGAGGGMGGDLGDGAARQMDRAERRTRQDRILGRQGDGRRRSRARSRRPASTSSAPAALSEAHLPEKAFRDARIFDIYEGTGEIQRLIIARDILGLFAEGAELIAPPLANAAILRQSRNS